MVTSQHWRTVTVSICATRSAAVGSITASSSAPAQHYGTRLQVKGKLCTDTPLVSQLLLLLSLITSAKYKHASLISSHKSALQFISWCCSGVNDYDTEPRRVDYPANNPIHVRSCTVTGITDKSRTAHTTT